MNIDAINSTQIQTRTSEYSTNNWITNFMRNSSALTVLNPCGVRVQSIIDFVMRTRVFVTQLTMINDIFRMFWLTVSRRVMNAHTFIQKMMNTNKLLTQQMTWMVAVYHYRWCAIWMKNHLKSHDIGTYRMKTPSTNQWTPLNINENWPILYIHFCRCLRTIY